jgi:1-acyl-sn-glycerol-3-phosphate acyltransferase
VSGKTYFLEYDPSRKEKKQRKANKGRKMEYVKKRLSGLARAFVVAHSGVVLGAIALLTCALVASFIVLSIFDTHKRVRPVILQTWAKAVLKVGRVKVTLTSAENVQQCKNYIFIVNHSSHFDIPIILATLPIGCCLLADEAFFKIPIMGTGLRKLGHIPVCANSAYKRSVALLAALRLLKNQQTSLALSPEGVRSRGRLSAFHNGAAFLSITSGVPILPIAIKGADYIMPQGSLIIRRGEVCLIFGKAIETDKDSSLKGVNNLTYHLRKTISALSGVPE